MVVASKAKLPMIDELPQMLIEWLPNVTQAQLKLSSCSHLKHLDSILEGSSLSRLRQKELDYGVLAYASGTLHPALSDCIPSGLCLGNPDTSALLTSLL